ncbi:MAG TPA: hypothetical protein VNQ73_21690 [Ilumatobacter sp.]|nr:hypothetical protein [Ilumatobacter sp.]
MTVTEQARKDLYDSLEHVHGREVATTLMEHLPPVGWADVARQSDIIAVRSDIDRLRTDMIASDDSLRSDIDRLRTDTGTLESRLRGDIDRLDRSIDERFDSKANMLRADLGREIRIWSLSIMGLTATMNAAVIALVSVVISKL